MYLNYLGALVQQNEVDIIYIYIEKYEYNKNESIKNKYINI